MIAADAPIKVAWVNLDQIRMDDQVIDGHQVQFYTSMLQGHDGHLAPPILNADMTVRDGRHRILGHQAAGRTHVRCLIIDRPAP